MNILQTSFYALIFLLLAGCSGVADLAYNHAPGFLADELDDAFDLNPAQIDQLDTRLANFFAWHRAVELARYRQVLERAALAAADGITAAEFLNLRDEINAAWDRSIARVIDDLGDLALSLSPQQIERFAQYHREGTEEYLEYLEKSEQQREIYRVDRTYSRLESWFGRFDSNLGERIRERLRQIPDIYQPWFEYREQRHNALLGALRAVPVAGFDRERLRRLLLDPDTEHSRAFEPARRAYWQAYATALEDISPWLSERQRQRAVTKLLRYARTVERLSRQS